MEAILESQLNIKLSSNPEFKLILDECTPKNKHSESRYIIEDLYSKLELISEDRERLKKECLDLQKERNGFIQDMINRKSLHEELSAWFSRLNSRKIRELEFEAKALSELLQKKSSLISRMQQHVQQSPIKENRPFELIRKKTFNLEVVPITQNSSRFSLSPTKAPSSRRRKVAAVRNSLFN